MDIMSRMMGLGKWKLQIDCWAEEESEKMSMSCRSRKYNNSRAFLIAISSAVNMLVEGKRDHVFEMFRIGMYTAEAVRLRFGQREPSV